MSRLCDIEKKLDAFYPTGRQCYIPNPEIRPVFVEMLGDDDALSLVGQSPDGLIKVRTTSCYDGHLVGGNDGSQVFPALFTLSYFGANGNPAGPPNFQEGCFTTAVNSCTRMRQFIIRLNDLDLNEWTQFEASLPDEVSVVHEEPGGTFTEAIQPDGTTRYTSNLSNTNQQTQSYVDLIFNDRESFVMPNIKYDWSQGGGVTAFYGAVYDDLVCEERNGCGDVRYTNLDGTPYTGGTEGLYCKDDFCADPPSGDGQGEQGPPGPPGDPGPQGDQGIQGPPGQDGMDAVLPFEITTEECILPVACISTNATAQVTGIGATAIRTATGQWTVVLDDPQPTADYCYTFGNQEEGNNRDAVDPSIVQGTQTTTGFDVQLTTGDNGAGADALVDTPWSVVIYGTKTIVVPDA